MSFPSLPDLQSTMHRNKQNPVNYLGENIVYNIRKVQ